MWKRSVTRISSWKPHQSVLQENHPGKYLNISLCWKGLLHEHHLRNHIKVCHKKIILEIISTYHYVEKVCYMNITLETTTTFVTKESSWKQSQSLTCGNGLSQWDHPGNYLIISLVWKRIGIPPCLVIFADDPKSRFVGRWTTWTSHMRKRRTLAFLASSHLVALFLSWRWPKSEK